MKPETLQEKKNRFPKSEIVRIKNLIIEQLPFCWTKELGLDDTGFKIADVIITETINMHEIIKLNQTTSHELTSRIDSLNNKTKILIDCFITPEEFEKWKEERSEGTIMPWKEQALSIIESFEF